MDGVDASASSDGGVVMLRKRPALDAASTYALVVTRDARAGGAAVLPSFEAALLLSNEALAANGRSATALLDDARAVSLESARKGAAHLLDGLGQRGLTRDKLALAVPFTTMDAYAFVDGYARIAEERGVEPDLVDVDVESPWDRGLYAVLPHVDTVVSGRFRGLDFLDPVTLRKSADGPRAYDVPFVLTVPSDVEGPVPVVIFGHGLITAKELSYLIADELAQAGFATFAIDLPMHGERTVCLVDAHCAPFGTCGEAHQCVDGDGAPADLAAGESPWPGGPRIPLGTGEAFVLVDDLVASRDHFLQGVVDLRQALRLLESTRLDSVVDGVTFAHDDLSWLGISLGGVFGAALSGATNDVNSLVLNVPGADLVVTLEDSTVLSPLLDNALRTAEVERGSPAFLDYEDVAHLVLDPVDPMNLAPRATRACPSEWREKRLLLQMADSDLVVPNTATQVLSEVTGEPIHEFHAIFSNHGFLLDPTSIEGGRARSQAVDFLHAR